MSEQITDDWEGTTKAHEASRQLAAYIVFGLSMGFLFGTLVNSVLGGVLFGVAIGSLPVIRPDFHRPATIHRERACPEGARANELDTWRSGIVLPTRYRADAAFGSVKRAVARPDQAEAQGTSAWVGIPDAITDLERRSPGESDAVH